MNTKKMGIGAVTTILLLFVLTCFPGWTVDTEEPTSDSISGEKLVREIWAEIKAQNWPVVESKIAPQFQSVHTDGARNREVQIKLLKNLNLGEYELSDFKTTRNGSIIIVTYSAVAEETINGKKVSSKPTMRLSVWLKTESGWQWIAHANLSAIHD